MSRSLAPDLPEAFDLVHRNGEIIRNFSLGVDRTHAREVQCGVEQHRGVTGRQNKSIAVRPRGIRRIVAEEALPQRIDHRSEPHRRAGMTRICLLHCVDRQSSDGIDAHLVADRESVGVTKNKVRLAHIRSCCGQEDSRRSCSDFRCTAERNGQIDFTPKWSGMLVWPWKRACRNRGGSGKPHKAYIFARASIPYPMRKGTSLAERRKTRA